MVTTQATKRSRMVARSPIYYGWIVWVVATLGLIATAPGQSFTVSLFFDSFIKDFELSRTTVSTLYGLGTFAASLSLTWFGHQIDRFGNRQMGVMTAAAFSIAVMMMSMATGPLTLLIGFVAIRGLGQGALSLANTTVVAEWFQRLRGRMMSLSVVVFALFQAAYVPWLQRQMEIYGWRHMWQVLAILVASVAIPLLWLLMRDRPEDYGLTPDGGALDYSREEGDTLEGSGDWTLKEAMRTPMFWVFIFGRIIPPSWGTGLIIHQVSIFEAVGHSARTAAQTFGLITLLMAGASVVIGWLVDQMRPGYVVVIQQAALILAMLLATVMTTQPLLYLYAASFGVMMATGGVFDGAVWVNVFGRKNQGALRGFTATTLIAASATGPILFGLSYDYLGGYRPILILGVICAALVTLAAIKVPLPHKDAGQNQPGTAKAA